MLTKNLLNIDISSPEENSFKLLTSKEFIILFDLLVEIKISFILCWFII